MTDPMKEKILERLDTKDYTPYGEKCPLYAQALRVAVEALDRVVQVTSRGELEIADPENEHKRRVIACHDADVALSEIAAILGVEK